MTYDDTMIDRLRRLWWRIRLHSVTGVLMARCRACGSSKGVLVFDPRGLWAYFWRNTYCPEHCPDHDFKYDRGMRRWCCEHCSEDAPHDFWAYHD